MAKANIYVRAPVWAATDRIVISGANVYVKSDTVAGGNASIHTANGLVIGVNSSFTTQFKPGDVVLARWSPSANVWQEARVVANVASATRMNVTAVFSAADSTNTIQKADYFVVNSAYGWAKAKLLTANATTSGPSTVVTLGAAQANTIVKGDKIVFVNANVRATRTVTAVNGTTSINVNANVNITAANASAIFKIEEVLYAANNLDTRIRTNA